MEGNVVNGSSIWTTGGFSIIMNSPRKYHKDLENPNLV